MPQVRKKKWTMGKRKLGKNLWEVFEAGVYAGLIGDDPRAVGRYRFVDRFGKPGFQSYPNRQGAMVAMRARLRQAKKLGTKNWRALEQSKIDTTA